LTNIITPKEVRERILRMRTECTSLQISITASDAAANTTQYAQVWDQLHAAWTSLKAAWEIAFEIQERNLA